MFCKYYCGLLPTFIIEGNAEFQLEINENIDVIFPPFEFIVSLNSTHEP